ncbi:MAG TPA: hypothetical protein DIC35_02350 [Candidatus Moranbacteria bacterium]|nr:hypothetical protein [Candidatus Moranbacteria bacterium]
MPKKTNKSNVVGIAALGATLAGLAAGAYFFFGPNGKKNQKNAKAWAIKMKGDVVEKLEAAKEVTEPIYHNIIDTVAKKYAKGTKATQAEIDELAKDLKKHWKTISAAVAEKKSSKKK